MKSTTKYLSDTKVELTITLDKADMHAAEQVALTKLAKKTKVPGFRKGKAPASVMAKHVSPTELEQQALEDALSKAVAEAFIKNELQALERPAVDIKEFEPGTSLVFTAEAEILPKVILGDYRKLKVTKPKVAVAAAEIDEVLERLRNSQATTEVVERAAKNGDEVVIDFVGKKGDTPFDGGAAENHTLRLGSNSFIPGFEEGIVGKKAGDEFDINLTFPENYHSSELSGQAVVFSITLKEVKKVALPKLDDEFAAKSGPFKTLVELKASIKEEMTAQREAEATDKMKDQVVEKLIAVSKISVPEILLADQARSVEQDINQNLAYQGRMLDDFIQSEGYDSKEEWVEKAVKPIAKKRVEAALVLAELSKVEKITASTKDVDARIAMYKDQYKNSPHMLAEFSKPDVRQDIASRLLTDKTVERLLELNTK